MKRKIIKQGHNTLTVTLPSKWAKHFNLKAGDEIDLSERDNGIFITTEKKNKSFMAEIDIRGLDVPSIWKYFMAVYREGYDGVVVKFDPTISYESPYKFTTTHKIDINYNSNVKKRKHTPFEAIQEITNRFIGFEIIEHHNDYCIIKDMSEPSSKEFESSLRRVFLLIQQMGEEILETLKTGKRDFINHLHDIDINVDKFHDYCLRVLNKTGFKEQRKTHLMFAILYLLEMLADEYKSISNHILIDMKDKALGNILPFAELTTGEFNTFYDLFYKFDKKKIVEISDRDREIYSYLPKLYKKNPNKRSQLRDDELEIFNHFRRISKYINSLIELRIEMEF